MSVVARRFSASPKRLSSETWRAITALVCRSDSKSAAEFGKVAGIAGCLINDKLLANHPLVVTNQGPRLRVYCLYGEEAVDSEDQNEAALSWSPTESDWRAYLPCTSDDMADFKSQMKNLSAKFALYDIKEGLEEDKKTGAASTGPAADVAVDWEAFKKL